VWGMTTAIDIGSRCVWCGVDTSAGSGHWVNRLGVGTTGDTVFWLPTELRQQSVHVTGWSCAECAGYECEICEKQIPLDEDVTDLQELGHYHYECLPLDQHWTEGN
jgi:hypothetical protein